MGDVLKLSSYSDEYRFYTPDLMIRTTYVLSPAVFCIIPDNLKVLARYNIPLQNISEYEYTCDLYQCAHQIFSLSIRYGRT